MTSSNDPETRGAGVTQPFVGSHPQARRRARRWLMPVLVGFSLLMGLLFAFLAPYLVVPLLVPLVVLALVSIWALPSLKTAPTRAFEVLFWAFFVLLVMWPNYIAIALPGLPWITMIRLTGFPLVVILLVCVSISAEFRAQSAEVLRALPEVWKLLVAFSVIQVLSLAFSHQMADGVQRLIVYLTSWTAIFFASVWVFRKPRRVEIWAALMCVMAIPIGFIGLWESRLSHVPWAFHIPRIFQIEPDLLQAILQGNTRAANGVYRIQSVFTTPLTLAQYLSFTMPFLIHFGVSRIYRPWMRLAAFASIPFVIYIIYLSGSRLGMVGAILSVLGYTLFWGVSRWRRRQDNLVAAAIVFSYPLLFVGAIASTFFIGHLRAIVWGDGAQDASNDSRKEQYKKGLHLLLHHPWGYGIDQGAAALGMVSSDGKLTIDTYWIAIALNYGILGFILFNAMIILAFYKAGVLSFRSLAGDREFTFLAPLAIALGNFFVISSIFAQQDNNPLVFMMLGMVVALAWRMAPPKAAAARRLSPGRPFLARPALARDIHA